MLNGPFDTRLELLHRAQHFIHCMIRNTDPLVTAYRVYGHKNLTSAYGTFAGSGLPVTTGPALLPGSMVGLRSSSASPSVIQRRQNRVESSAQLKKRSHIFFDLLDFDTITEIPSDTQWFFARVQEYATTPTPGWREVLAGPNAAEPVLGPIYVIPPSNVLNFPNVPVNLVGVAPGGTGAASGENAPLDTSLTTPPPLHLVLARTGTFRLRTQGAPLLYAFGLNQPMALLPADFETVIPGGVKEIVLAGVGVATADFVMTGTLDLGVEL